jgi:hypothetical protein
MTAPRFRPQDELEVREPHLDALAIVPRALAICFYSISQFSMGAAP